MVYITEKAKKRLRDDLNNKQAPGDQGLRIISVAGPLHQFMLKLDRKKTGDEAVTDYDGRVLLLLEPDLAVELKNKTLDRDQREFFIK